MQESLTKAQTSRSNQANKHWKKVFYDIGYKVWLSTKNISTDRSSNKLDHKMIGPFDVIGKKSISLELQLSQAMKIHNVFHSNLLRKASTDVLTGQVNEPIPPVIIDNEEEWEVEDILDTKSHRGKIQYRVKWTDWDKDRKWYDASGFDNFPEIVEDFDTRYPNKSRSQTKKNKTKRNNKAYKIRDYLLERPCI